MSIKTLAISGELISQTVLPDVIFTGSVYHSEDGSYPFKVYNGIEGFSQKVREIAGSDMRTYGAVCRSIYNYYDELTKVGFGGRVYGVDNDFFNQELKGYLKEGRFPEEGKLEAVVGSYFAKRFNISLGDKIPQTITLNETWTEDDLNKYILVSKSCDIVPVNKLSNERSDKKIGILKAIGISDIYITKTFIGGMSLIIFISVAVGLLLAYFISNTVNSYVSNFYGFRIEEYMLNSAVYIVVGLQTVLFLSVSYLLIFLKGMKISPKDAMLKA